MDELEQRFRDWALARADVEAVVVVGSRARTDHPADEWADLDLGIVTTDPKAYASDATWASEIGIVWIAYHDPVGTTWHLLFDGALDAGAAPIPASVLTPAFVFFAGLRAMPAARRLLPRGVQRRITRAEEEIAGYCGRGVRVLVDKRGRVARLLRVLPDRPPPVAHPSRAEIDAVVGEFWFIAVWTAKHLRRGEIWKAKSNGVDGRMKTLLLRMIEWHARSGDAAVDTWEDGRFIEEWAEARTRDELSGAFAHYDPEDVWTALLATMKLFARLDRETSGRLGLPYSAATGERVTAWVNERHLETLS